MTDALDTAISESGGDPSVIHDRERSRTLEIMNQEGVSDHLLAHERAVVEQSHREAHASNQQLAHAAHHWPTDEEVANARKYGFGYGTGREPYVEGRASRVYGSDLGTIRREMRDTQGEGEDSAGRALGTIEGLEPGTNLDLSKHPDIRASLKGIFAKTALAANRIPLATLGFDPTRVVVDMAGKLHYGHDAVFGQYGPANKNRDEELWERAGKELTPYERQKEFQWLSESGDGDQSSPRQRRYERLQSTVPKKMPGDDQIYVTAAGERMSRATLLHETIHRGIELLRTGDNSPEVAAALKTLGFQTSNNDEERFIEHLIARAGFRQPGSTQYGKAEELVRVFGSPEKQKAMAVLERAAQDLHAKRRERGPR